MPKLNFFTPQNLRNLTRTDERLGQIIARLGPVEMEADATFFESIVHQLFKQQISTALAEKIWKRFSASFDQITPNAFARLELEDLLGFGISRRRLGWVLEIARYLSDHPEFEERLWKTDRKEYFRMMTSLPGIGIWSAEMVGIFYFQREDIFSYGDVGIRRGLMYLYDMDHEPDRTEFAGFEKRFSPHLSLTSIYLWRLYEGFLPDIYDPSAKGRKTLASRTDE